MNGNGIKQVVWEFRKRRNRQLYAIAAAVILMIAVLWKQKHPGLILGEFSGEAVFWAEVTLITFFVVFTALNWRCPACGGYLGRDIYTKGCRKCGTGFQEE